MARPLGFEMWALGPASGRSHAPANAVFWIVGRPPAISKFGPLIWHVGAPDYDAELYSTWAPTSFNQGDRWSRLPTLTMTYCMAHSLCQ